MTTVRSIFSHLDLFEKAVDATEGGCDRCYHALARQLFPILQSVRGPKAVMQFVMFDINSVYRPLVQVIFQKIGIPFDPKQVRAGMDSYLVEAL